MLAISEVLRLFSYNPVTGQLFWNNRPEMPAHWNTRWAGKEIKGENEFGYYRVSINGKSYRAHILIWVILHGVWPVLHIDHKDGDPKNNKPDNLRLATYAQNNANQGLKSSNTTGFKGVVFLPSSKKFRATIKVNAQRIHLGVFNSAEEAHAAYVAAANKYHKEFARHR